MSVDRRTLRKLDRMLRQIERRARPRRRFSTAPIVLALALVLGLVLLAELVPRVWAATLQGGVEQAQSFGGLPALVGGMSVLSRSRFVELATIAAGVGLIAGLLSWSIRPLRWAVWLAALGAIVLDAGVLFVTMRVALLAALRSLGM